MTLRHYETAEKALFHSQQEWKGTEDDQISALVDKDQISQEQELNWIITSETSM